MPRRHRCVECSCAKLDDDFSPACKTLPCSQWVCMECLDGAEVYQPHGEYEAGADEMPPSRDESNADSRSDFVSAATRREEQRASHIFSNAGAAPEQQHRGRRGVAHREERNANDIFGGYPDAPSNNTQAEVNPWRRGQEHQQYSAHDADEAPAVHNFATAAGRRAEQRSSNIFGGTAQQEPQPPKRAAGSRGDMRASDIFNLKP